MTLSSIGDDDEEALSSQYATSSQLDDDLAYERSTPGRGTPNHASNTSCSNISSPTGQKIGMMGIVQVGMSWNTCKNNRGFISWSRGVRGKPFRGVTVTVMFCLSSESTLEGSTSLNPETYSDRGTRLLSSDCKQGHSPQETSAKSSEASDYRVNSAVQREPAGPENTSQAIPSLEPDVGFAHQGLFLNELLCLFSPLSLWRYVFFFLKKKQQIIKECLLHEWYFKALCRLGWRWR